MIIIMFMCALLVGQDGKTADVPMKYKVRPLRYWLPVILRSGDWVSIAFSLRSYADGLAQVTVGEGDHLARAV